MVDHTVNGASPRSFPTHRTSGPASLKMTAFGCSFRTVARKTGQSYVCHPRLGRCRNHHYIVIRVAARLHLIRGAQQVEMVEAQALDERDSAMIEEGRALLKGDINCTECHQFRNKDEDATGPDLTGYGSREWLIRMISNPTDPGHYGKRNDRMPKFGDDQILNPHAIGLLADWLRGEWYEPAIAESGR
jgi:mono/diheme cytochrome c family protein